MSAKNTTTGKSKLTTIIIVLFAILMAGSMVMPSLSQIFAGNTQSETTDTAKEDTGSSTSSSTPTTMAELDAQYQGTISKLEADLANDENNLADLLNIGSDYLSWAYQGSFLAASDAERDHVVELYQKAMGYFDRYLALNDSQSVRVDRALAQFYSGDTEGAMAYLTDYTQGDGATYGPAWANLGMMYQFTRDYTNAETCYRKAMSTDPNNKTGAYAYASRMMAAMQQAQSEGDDSESSDASSEEGLSDTLASSAGTTL